MWKPTSLNWQEPAAYAASLMALAGGLYLGLACDKDWLGRAGSLVIIIGVLLAASRKMDLLHAKVLLFIENYRRKNSSLVRDEMKLILGRDPTDHEVSSVENAIYASAKKELEELIEERRRVFKLHEVALVIAGTFVNGFGPWLIGWLSSAA
jgi:hypothetical protein